MHYFALVPSFIMKNKTLFLLSFQVFDHFQPHHQRRYKRRVFKQENAHQLQSVQQRKCVLKLLWSFMRTSESKLGRCKRFRDRGISGLPSDDGNLCNLSSPTAASPTSCRWCGQSSSSSNRNRKWTSGYFYVSNRSASLWSIKSNKILRLDSKESIVKLWRSVHINGRRTCESELHPTEASEIQDEVILDGSRKCVQTPAQASTAPSKCSQVQLGERQLDQDEHWTPQRFHPRWSSRSGENGSGSDDNDWIGIGFGQLERWRWGRWGRYRKQSWDCCNIIQPRRISSRAAKIVSSVKTKLCHISANHQF